MGGIDICYGRFDTNEHSLSDPGQSSLGGNLEEKFYSFPGIDYSNARIMDFINVQTPDVCNIDRE